jgi:murein L,D-transpeptidase YcbB/YkuD
MSGVGVANIDFKREKPVFTVTRAVCAALLLSAAPAVAADSQASHPSAVDIGLAIPIAGVDDRRPADPQPALIPQRGRFVLVDAASARLYMIEDGEVRDSMRVIVGKPSSETPPIRSNLFYATFNPYWNVPVDLARTLIAPNVLDQGMSYLRERGYEVVTGFSDDAEVIDPETVDWQAVADGSVRLHVRQRPGPANSMGEVKFWIANADGIFLHDTPRKELFDSADRGLSAGCVRLEDAERFAEWLLGEEVDPRDAPPEQHVALPAAVPIVITYLPESQGQTLAALH